MNIIDPLNKKSTPTNYSHYLEEVYFLLQPLLALDNIQTT
jgi:hypothetical protein